MTVARPFKRPLLATAAIAVVLLLQSVGGYVYGAARTPSAVAAQLAGQGYADIAVRLGFVPEDFNLTYLENRGVVVRSSGDTIYLRYVAASDVAAIAGQYWVSGITAWSGG